jgi:hypothetical protein
MVLVRDEGSTSRGPSNADAIHCVEVSACWHVAVLCASSVAVLHACLQLFNRLACSQARSAHLCPCAECCWWRDLCYCARAGAVGARERPGAGALSRMGGKGPKAPHSSSAGASAALQSADRGAGCRLGCRVFVVWTMESCCG